MSDRPFGTLLALPLRNGVSYPSAQRGSGVRMVNMREIFANDRITDSVPCELVPLTASERESSLLGEGDLLFARQSLTYEGAGKVSLVLDSTAPTWDSHLIRARLDRSKADPAFYYYFFRSAEGRRRVETIVQQVAAAGIRGSELARLSVPVPPLPEQQAIAEVLGALDDKIAANTRLAATADELNNTLFRASSSVHSNVVTISDLASVLTRGSAPRYVDDHSLSTIVLNQKCVRDQRVSLEPARRTESKRIRADRMLMPGDVLVNSTGQGTLGRVARWTSDGEATVDSHITIVRVDPLVHDPFVAGQAILLAEPRVEALGEGSTGQTELSKSELGKLEVRLPLREHTPLLAQNLRSNVASRDAVLAENEVLAATRDALLPKLMSGELRVRDAVSTVAEVL